MRPVFLNDRHTDAGFRLKVVHNSKTSEELRDGYTYVYIYIVSSGNERQRRGSRSGLAD